MASFWEENMMYVDREWRGEEVHMVGKRMSMR